MIFDKTSATGYRAFRIEAGGGVRGFEDHDVPRTKRWLGSQWELYHFEDRVPSQYVPSSYIGRGEFSGVTTHNSPLTNWAEAGDRTVSFIEITARLRRAERVVEVSWSSVPGAAGYWFHAYTYRNAQSIEEFLSGVPAPLYDSKSSDLALFYVPAGALEVDSTGTPRAQVEVFEQRPLPPSFAFLMRVTAVNARGELVGQTPGSAGKLIGQGEYALYLRGALDFGQRDPVSDIALVTAETLLARGNIDVYQDPSPSGGEPAPPSASFGRFLGGVADGGEGRPPRRGAS